MRPAKTWAQSCRPAAGKLAAPPTAAGLNLQPSATRSCLTVEQLWVNVAAHGNLVTKGTGNCHQSCQRVYQWTLGQSELVQQLQPLRASSSDA